MTQVYFHCSNTKKVFVDQRRELVEEQSLAVDLLGEQRLGQAVARVGLATEGPGAAAGCVDQEEKLAVLDPEINAFNDLLATKCGS